MGKQAKKKGTTQTGAEVIQLPDAHLQRLAAKIGKCLQSPEKHKEVLAFALAEYLKIDPGEVPLIDLGIDHGVDPEQLRAANPVFPAALGMKFAYIPAGKFQMGSPESEANRSDAEVQHEVVFTEPYWMGVYPVTVGDFEQFIQATRYQAGVKNRWRSPGFSQTERHPVVNVSWNDAQAMAKWLNEQAGTSGLQYALPTETQWEYACRAGTQTAYWFGNDADKLGECAWFGGNANSQTHPVETKRPNPWGLYHMHGSIWEWCQDWYGPYLTDGVKNGGRLVSETGGSARVLRGGCWGNAPQLCRSAYRGSNVPGHRYSYLGFRLAVSTVGGDLTPRPPSPLRRGGVRAILV